MRSKWALAIMCGNVNIPMSAPFGMSCFTTPSDLMHPCPYQLVGMFPHFCGKIQRLCRCSAQSCAQLLGGESHFPFSGQFGNVDSERPRCQSYLCSPSLYGKYCQQQPFCGGQPVRFISYVWRMGLKVQLYPCVKLDTPILGCPLFGQPKPKVAWLVFGWVGWFGVAGDFG